MGVFRFITEEETKQLKLVSDPEINELLQEALTHDDSLLIDERCTGSINKRVGWFKKERIQTYSWTVYHESRAHDGSAYQAQYISGLKSDKHSVTTYLLGIINGAISIKWDYAKEKFGSSTQEENIYLIEYSIGRLQDKIYQANVDAGWHNNLDGSERSIQEQEAMFPTRIALCHSELSEALEGFRKSLMDDHLTNRPMAEVELADTVIRIFDLAGAMGYDLSGAIFEKMEYNKNRADHKPENRNKTNGKKF